MKLRNKKTGEILPLGSLIIKNPNRINCESIINYNSLAELNEDWEDYEEQKGYWYINEFGTPTEIIHTRENIYDKQRKNFGNYFETKEEAERAVEKLKAWKRLKDLGFRFIGKTREYKSDKQFGTVFFEISGEIRDIYEDNVEFYDDLDLLFGGEDA